MSAKIAYEAAQKPLKDRDPIYVVTGFPRSGTSMMMRCLDLGGIPAEYNRKDRSHKKLEKATGFLANPHGYYERGRGTEPWWFPAGLEGRCVKMELASTAVMAPGQRFRIIVMQRDPKAIETSLRTYTEAIERVAKVKPQLTQALETVRTGRYWEIMGVGTRHLRNRRDVEHLVEVAYERLLEDPRELFDKLVDVGWPLDAEVASAVPDVKWRRSG